AKQAGESRGVQSDIAEINVLAERRAGELPREMEKHKDGGEQRCDLSITSRTAQTPTRNAACSASSRKPLPDVTIHIRSPGCTSAMHLALLCQ
ncbi:MAG: hypothetical protein WBE26_17430, partial [Phycisphaerae bacterium]